MTSDTPKARKRSVRPEPETIAMQRDLAAAHAAWVAKYRDQYPADPDALDEDGEPLDLLAPPEVVTELKGETDRIREHYTALYNERTGAA
jgi:hypothetical protein